MPLQLAFIVDSARLPHANAQYLGVRCVFRHTGVAGISMVLIPFIVKFVKSMYTPDMSWLVPPHDHACLSMSVTDLMKQSLVNTVPITISCYDKALFVYTFFLFFLFSVSFSFCSEGLGVNVACVSSNSERILHVSVVPRSVSEDAMFETSVSHISHFS